MGGVLLEGVQIDSKSGMLTLFGPRSQDMRSVAFDVTYNAYMVVAYNLLPGQTVTLYSVAQIDGTTREAIFSYNGSTIVLTSANPTALVAFTGTYRWVMNSPVGSVVVRAYPQLMDSESVSPVKSDIVNSLALVAGVLSPIQQVQYKPHTVTVYGLPTGQVVDIFAAFGDYSAHVTTLSEGSITYSLDKTGDYRFVASANCVVTIRPNYIEFDNPYKTKGDKGDTGPAGTSGGITYTQVSPSNTWVINHNLGYKPAVELFNVGGVEFDASVTHTSVNQTIIDIAMPIAGTARLT